MLNNIFGTLLYFLLRNDISWKLLTKEEREMILHRNNDHNVNRNAYKNPEKYGATRLYGKETWDTSILRADDYWGNRLLQLLEEINPKNVLEIGPGPGFYTKMICEYPSVKHYTAIEIGQAFIDFLKDRLKKFNKKNFSFDLICNEFFSSKTNRKYDFIILLSTVHHIPDRLVLFKKLNSLLKKNGYIYCCDPTHYLIRLNQLLKKLILKRYLFQYYRAKDKIGTHNMCTYEEYKGIIRRIPDLKIDKVYYSIPEKIKSLSLLPVFKKWLSSEMGILFKK